MTAYHVHMRWVAPLPLASDAPRRTLRRASWRLITVTMKNWKPTTTANNQYLWDAAAGNRVDCSTHFCTDL